MAGAILFWALLAIAAEPTGGKPPSGLAEALGEARAAAQARAEEANSLAPAPGSSVLPAADRSLRGDARLWDVCFINSRCGWAIGDRGTIWHTEDGGQHWELQESGIGCTLRSVSFVNERCGWAAGGLAHPFTHGGSGVLLWTEDGGRHWTREATLVLPPLRQVRFLTERQGWAIGCSSAMNPAGVFYTRDAGRTWLPSCAAVSDGWLTGDLLDGRTGLLAGHLGQAATFQGGELTRSRTADFGLRGLRAVRLVPPVYGWLVGDGGLIRRSADLGQNWAPPPGGLPAEIALFDFAALAVRGPRCWVAGSPGSRVFHTSDAGRTWTAHFTGSTPPLRAIAFADDEHGWTVGDLGTILATVDGGRTWRRQRAGGARAALMAIASRAEDLPLEMLARSCAGDGLLGVVEVVGRQDIETSPRGDVSPEDRAHEAALAVGASACETAWQFPLRQPGLTLPARQILAGWDRANDGRGEEALVTRLVRQIRTWRPTVLVIQDPGDGDPLATLVQQMVAAAAARAADPGYLPEKFGSAGLEPWRVVRVCAIATAREGNDPTASHSTLSTAQLVPRLGTSVAEASAWPRGLLADRPRPGPTALLLRVVAGPALADLAGGDPMSGIALTSDGGARRPVGAAPAAGADIVQRLAQRRRNSQAILDRLGQDPQAGDCPDFRAQTRSGSPKMGLSPLAPSPARLLAQTDELTRGLDPQSAAMVIYRMADGCHRSGQRDLAAEMYRSLVARYPESPLCRAALLWLLHDDSSCERPASEAAEGEAARLERAANLGRQIEQTRPDLFADPAIRYPLASVYRRLGQPKAAERLRALDTRGLGRDAWWACAQGERWLAEAKGAPLKPLAACVKAAGRPRLDGRLDDAVWQQAKPLTLASPLGDDADWPAVALLAHDAEFLYLAVRCRQAPGVCYDAADGSRRRDTDLSARDRIDVLLDIDRDYATFYRLSIDHRGWAADEALGDTTWNPTWHIAARAEEGHWTIEAAIAFRELGIKTPLEGGATWAVNIQRIVPGIGLQAWSAPAAIDPRPEGAGYLKFE